MIPAPLTHTMKLVWALIRAARPFELLIALDVGHGAWTPAGEEYTREAARRCFQKHLKP